MNDWEELERELLRFRAEELAKPVDEIENLEDRIALLEFSLMGTRYSVLLEKVEAVTRIGEIFSIPLTPRHISGIIRRRGKSIALMSLRHFFHSDAEGIADADFAVIVRAKEKTFAIQVEEIQGVIHMGKGAILSPPENYDSAQSPYMSGITLEGMSVIDLEALVDTEGFSVGKR